MEVSIVISRLDMRVKEIRKSLSVDCDIVGDLGSDKGADLVQTT